MLLLLQHKVDRKAKQSDQRTGFEIQVNLNKHCKNCKMQNTFTKLRTFNATSASVQKVGEIEVLGKLREGRTWPTHSHILQGEAFDTYTNSGEKAKASFREKEGALHIIWSEKLRSRPGL